MHYFRYKGKKLYCEDTPLETLTGKFGTPLYVYSHRAIIEHFEELKKAFSLVDPLICYSVKANSNLAILKTLIKQGAGLDIVSGGELFRAEKAGCVYKKIVYASVGKTSQEIEYALKKKIFMFNAESLSELQRINDIAAKHNKKAAVSIRVNPDVDSKTHKYITTGRKETKFGVPLPEAERIILSRANLPFVEIKGLHIHIGSQITSEKPFVRAINKILNLLGRLKQKNIRLEYFNIGGGFGIVYNREKPKTASALAKAIVPLLRKTRMKIILEPGRFIVGNAGVLLTKVLYLKKSLNNKLFIITDAAMNDLLRPSLYGAYHNILPVVKRRSISALPLADIVGPVCESGDFLGKNRRLYCQPGDLLAVMSAGAYGFSMASNYNSRCKPAEVIVKGDKYFLVGRRQSYKDLISKEIMVDV